MSTSFKIAKPQNNQLTDTNQSYSNSISLVGMPLSSSLYNANINQTLIWNGVAWTYGNSGSSITGPTGSIGIPGNTVLNGTTNPSIFIGNDGDFYINYTTNKIFT